MYKKFKQFVYKLLIPFIRLNKYINWLLYLKFSKEINLVVGAANTKFKGWFSTDIVTLDVTNEDNFRKYFKDRKIDRILAEHVLEHLTSDEIKIMVRNFYKFSSKNVNIRVAVPDGYHNDVNYINYVKPGGTGEGAHDHKHLFNYKSLSSYFETVGFQTYPREFWDENGKFHSNYSNDENGIIRRSFINDTRNSNRVPSYTSLILDFKKH
jgi:predicted SAM-dependent methyltransferase